MFMLPISHISVLNFMSCYRTLLIHILRVCHINTFIGLSFGAQLEILSTAGEIIIKVHG